MSEFIEFPKWKYHPKKDAVVVEHAEAEQELGDEWGDLPHPKPEVEHADISEEPCIERAIQKNRPGRRPRIAL